MNKETSPYSNIMTAAGAQIADEFHHKAFAYPLHAPLLNECTLPSTSALQPASSIDYCNCAKGATAEHMAAIHKEIAFGQKMMLSLLTVNQQQKRYLPSVSCVQPNLLTTPLTEMFCAISMQAATTCASESLAINTESAQSDYSYMSILSETADPSGISPFPESSHTLSYNSKNKLGRSYNPGRPLNMQDRQQILQLYQRGLKVSHIAKVIGVTHSCVSKIMSRYRKTGSMRPRSGKQHPLSRQEQLQQSQCQLLLKPTLSPSANSLTSSVSSSSSPIPLASLRMTISPMLVEYTDINPCCIYPRA